MRGVSLPLGLPSVSCLTLYIASLVAIASELGDDLYVLAPTWIIVGATLPPLGRFQTDYGPYVNFDLLTDQSTLI